MANSRHDSPSAASPAMTEDSYRDLGIAKLDLSRAARTGSGEGVYAPGKSREQLAEILAGFRDANCPVIATRCSSRQARHALKAGLPVDYDPVSRTLISTWGDPPRRDGVVAVCTGGTGDLPVAEEAARTIGFLGASVRRYYDVGVAGLHRLLDNVGEIRQADVVVAVAGMEGALASVLTGLVEAPVIAVPTSVGYGASFGGVAPLLSMLNSCAEGMGVVNIDNGFGAAVLACRMLRIHEAGSP